MPLKDAIRGHSKPINVIAKSLPSIEGSLVTHTISLTGVQAVANIANGAVGSIVGCTDTIAGGCLGGCVGGCVADASAVTGTVAANAADRAVVVTVGAVSRAAVDCVAVLAAARRCRGHRCGKIISISLGLPL